MRYPVNHIAITQGFHQGKSIDFGWYNHHNQDVYSISNGYVLKIEKQKTGGNCVWIKHVDGKVSLYAHLDTIKVKHSSNVLMGEKIGTMGKTGIVTGEHLHLGIYSEEKANKGFNSKGLYGNADINPFEYLEVYEGQEVYKGTLEKYNIRFHENYTTGRYKLIYAKAIRRDHYLGEEYIVKVGECYLDIRDDLTSNRLDDEAFYRAGAIVDITEIYEDETTRIWGKLRNCWIVLQNRDGSPQATKIR